jgi:hypothetical protein
MEALSDWENKTLIVIFFKTGKIDYITSGVLMTFAAFAGPIRQFLLRLLGQSDNF